MILKLFAAVYILFQAGLPSTEAEYVEKWHKLNEFQQIFIETEQKYNWFKAWDECAERNMTLLNVDTSEKSGAIMALLRKIGESSIHFWIGGNDLGEEGKFVWHSTGKRFEFTNWKIGNPDNDGGNEGCVHLWGKTNFQWNDAKCTQKLGFICEPNPLLEGVRREWELKKQVMDRLFEL